MSKRTLCKISVDIFLEYFLPLRVSTFPVNDIYFYNIPLPLPTCVSEFMSQLVFRSLLYKGVSCFAFLLSLHLGFLPRYRTKTINDQYVNIDITLANWQNTNIFLEIS